MMWYLKISLVQLQNLVVTSILQLFAGRKRKIDLVRFGTSYGGWQVPKSWLENQSSSSLISAGIGNDVSFDLEIAKLGWNIVMVDPLKEACEYAQTHLSKFDRISIFNACLWKFDGVVNIYTPRDSSSNSYSITNEWHTDQVIDSKSVSLLTLLTKIENANVDNVYIKIDIEGAELELFEDLIKWQKRFDFLGIELDSLHLVPFLSVGTRFRRLIRVIAQLRKMRRNNWQFVHREGFNFFFVTNRKCII
jgi:FkbM family methyltransferase